MAVNKVEFGNQTIMDITDTSATPDGVVEGQIFYTAAGVRSTGTLGDATTNTHGLMSVADKNKLDTYKEPFIVNASIQNDTITIDKTRVEVFNAVDNGYDVQLYCSRPSRFANDSQFNYRYTFICTGGTTPTRSLAFYNLSDQKISNINYLVHSSFIIPEPSSITLSWSDLYFRNSPVSDIQINGTSIVSDKIANIVNSTTSTDGLMSAADKTKLDTLETIEVIRL